MNTHSQKQLVEEKYKAKCKKCNTIYTQNDFLVLNICSGQCPICGEELEDVK